MGYLRFFLLLAVVHSHTWLSGIQGSTAVFGFYVISAFLITRILNEVYPASGKGTLLFLQNRFWRIYPTFWLCFGIVIFFLYITQERMLTLHPFVGLPRSGGEWIGNLLVVGTSSFRGRNGVMVIPGSPSLGIELAFYLIVGLITGRSKLLTWAGFFTGILLIFYQFRRGTSYEFLYFSLLGPSMIFFLGSLCYFYYKRLAFLCTTKLWIPMLLASIVVYAPSLLGYRHDPLTPCMLWMYASSFVIAYCVLCLYHRSLLRKTSATEQFLADISYPMFLLHFPLAGTMSYYLYDGYHFGWDTFAMAVSASLLCGSAVVLYVERPLKKVRAAVRNHALRERAYG